ncbi:hypothetical protein [Sulfuricurvum sp.]|uniref:hypothetical protein n=1 Tax=Sulfuricurvum sp. TaxID=2025608 RepID=UPI00286D9CE9|nr:hypothetical protein [Sulfuricurvum sp.]
MTLSKSLYTRGIQCSKSLWLKKYSSGVLSPPDATALARFEMGNIVGDLACALFPNGREIPYMEKNFAGMAELTREWMDEGLGKKKKGDRLLKRKKGTGYLFPFSTPLILIENTQHNDIFTVDQIRDCATSVD